jgi:hypothetical protein
MTSGAHVKAYDVRDNLREAEHGDAVVFGFKRDKRWET